MMTGRVRAGTVVAAMVIALVVGTPPVRSADFETLYDSAMTARAAGNFAAAEAALKQALALRPGDARAVLQLGLVQGFQRQYAEALQTIRGGLAAAPGDFDLRLAEARVLGWMGDNAGAAAKVDDLLAEFPGNVEALNLKGRLALYRADPAAAEAAFAEVLRREPGNEEAARGLADARKASAEAAPTTRLSIGYTQSRFARSQNADWREVEADLVFDLDEATRLLAYTQVSNRFGSTDTYVRAGIERRLGPDLLVRVQAGATPGADFLPRWTAEAGADYRVSEGTGTFGPTDALIDLKQRHYSTGDIRNVDPGIRQYFLDGRVWLTGRWINSFDVNAGNKRLTGWSARADWQASDRLRLFAGRSNAPETEQGATVDTVSTFGGVVVEMTPLADLSVAYTHDNRQNSYLRDAVSATIGYRF